NCPQFPRRFTKRYAGHLTPREGHHLTKLLLVNELDGFGTEDGAEGAVHIGGATAALQVTEHDAASFLAGQLLNFRGDLSANAPQPGFTILRLISGSDKICSRRPGSLRNDH